MISEGNCGEIGGMKIGRGNLSVNLPSVKIMFQVGYYLDYITVTFTVSFCKHKDE
jgi:hypothetical protein